MITDPEAIRFVNEVVRPEAESMIVRYLDAKREVANIDLILTRWNQINSKINNDDKVDVQDGRGRDGVPQLNGRDVWLLITQLQERKTELTAMITRIETVGVREVLVKPAVQFRSKDLGLV